MFFPRTPYRVIAMNAANKARSGVTADRIIAYVNCIAARFNPLRIMLFGSYASGRPNRDSDVDLLITRSRWSMSPLTAAGKVRVELGVPFPMDLIVRTEADVLRRIAAGDSFLREVLETGITLYAADDARVGRQGRIRLRRRLLGSGPPSAKPDRVFARAAAFARRRGSPSLSRHRGRLREPE